MVVALANRIAAAFALGQQHRRGEEVDSVVKPIARQATSAMVTEVHAVGSSGLFGHDTSASGCEGENRDRPLRCEGSPVRLEAIQLVKSVGSEVALSAVRAANDRNALNQERSSTLADAAGQPSNSRALPSANIAHHGHRASSART